MPAFILSNMIDIRPAEISGNLEHVRTLFREYADSLGVSLDFQNFEAELASLPGSYAPPHGRLLVAWSGSDPVGCVALRPIDGIVCEMKRLYVRSAARGQQLGRRLAERICDEAREAGYSRICLDTLPNMTAAIQLYVSLGFQPSEPHVSNPIQGTHFLSRDL